MDKVEGFREQDHPLGDVATAVWDGHVFINLSARPQPFAGPRWASWRERLRPWRMEDLVRVERRVYPVRANWKLIVQNYSECLHCPVVHPLLHEQSHYMSGENDTPRPTWIGGRMDLRDGVETLSMDGRSGRACLPGLREPQTRQVHYYALLPNLLLNLHPDYMLTLTLWPRAVDQHRRGGGLALPSRRDAQAGLRSAERDRRSGTSRTARTGSSRSGPRPASPRRAIGPDRTRIARSCCTLSTASSRTAPTAAEAGRAVSFARRPVYFLAGR